MPLKHLSLTGFLDTILKKHNGPLLLGQEKIIMLNLVLVLCFILRKLLILHVILIDSCQNFKTIVVKVLGKNHGIGMEVKPNKVRTVLNVKVEVTERLSALLGSDVYN